MSAINLTPSQRQAVTATGCSVIVSAAAGAGKTSVLAERCAYLVCDAPPGEGCDVTQLVVLTFTDAAAAEMRGRIVEAIRVRSQRRPDDERLREQLSLAASAHICTIHAFCLWLLRRWFSEAGVDPSATLLDADEAALLREEVREELFAELYSHQEQDDRRLGRVSGEVPAKAAKGTPPPDRPDEARRQAFVKLVNDYGLGNDRNVAGLILKLAEFVRSLPDPRDWLEEAVESLTEKPAGVVLALLGDLGQELTWQSDYCAKVAAALEAGDPVGHFYAEQIRDYQQTLQGWAARLPVWDEARRNAKERPRQEEESIDLLKQFDTVTQDIKAYQLGRKRGPNLPKDAPPAIEQARDAAGKRWKEVKERLFRDRLRKRFGLFSPSEWLEGLGQVAPYVSTIVELVRSFREAYTEHKRRLGVLDFSDLECLAFNVLHEPADLTKPSEIARNLHRRFAYVLVDEFQDINPIQQAIIKLISREADPHLPNNLFVVGDVKQSIYRFRLAEPTVFTRRLEAFRAKESGDQAIDLQSNFRSRREILEAVNLMFRQLMRAELGEVAYDTRAELVPGREVDPPDTPEPVELHLLERRWAAGEVEEEPETPGRGIADPFDPARWQPIEREAFLIGSRVVELIESSAIKPNGQPLRYRDCAVLLRAANINAEKVVAILTMMGVPAYADAGGSLLGALEARDVLAALRVLDNLQQDIPLAAVLRSGIMGERLSEDDLVKIRCLDRDVPFHAAVRLYVERGRDVDLRERLHAILQRIDRYRAEVRRRPLAEVLWQLYEQSGYLAYVGGLPNGQQRRANLLKLHERARKFGTFRRQGLHRFLRFIEMLEDKKQDFGAAPAIGEAEDVVRIMSIHQSKGLEFPVVFVAGLGTKFNLGDRAGRMIFERQGKIGLRVIDPERMIEYPSAVHQQVAAEVERNTRAEELRVLYVAMTRAREKLILIGSANNVGSLIDRARFATSEPRALARAETPRGLKPAARLNPYPTRKASVATPSLLEIATAVTPLDWLIPALAAAPVGTIRWPADGPCETPLFDVRVHEPEEMARWLVIEDPTGREKGLLAAAARCAPLPAEEPIVDDNPQVEEVLTRISYLYPSLASASVRAVMAASEFKGTYDFRADPDAQPAAPLGGGTGSGKGEDAFTVPPSKYAAAPPESAAYRGIVTHRILQHLDFALARGAAGVASELQRMEAAGVVSPEDRALVDQAAIEWFVSTPLAASIRAVGEGYRREFTYIATEPPELFDPSVGSLEGETVLVRGIVDGILPVDGGIELIDFKTDAVAVADVAARSQRYRPQMILYARAMERIWQKPVRACWLVFLTARKVERVAGL